MTRIACAFACFLLAACAPEVVRRDSALMLPSTVAHYTVASPLSVRLDSGYSRTLAAGVRLADAGMIPEGRVLKPVSTVFTVEGTHQHEAYLVERSGRLVGFYLPVERAFSPLSESVPIQLQGESQK